MASNAAVSFDTTEVDMLAATLMKVSTGTMAFAAKAVEVTARHIKDDARKNVRSHFGHIPHVANAITYDVMVGVGSIKAEIGYDRNLVQGNLAHIIEYGSAAYNAPNAPQRNLGRALDTNIEDFQTGLQKAVLHGLGR